MDITTDQPLQGRTVYTIGLAGMRTPLDLVYEMRDRGVHTVLDLRHRFHTRPVGFKPPDLQKALDVYWIDYQHLGHDLRSRPLAMDYDGPGDLINYQMLLEDGGYQQGIAAIMAQMEQGMYVCLVCYHPNPLACHRDYMVGRTLAEKGASIEHILLPGEVPKEKFDCSY